MELRVVPITYSASIVSAPFPNHEGKTLRAYARIEPASDDDVDGEVTCRDSWAQIRIGDVTVSVGGEEQYTAAGGEMCWVPTGGFSYLGLARLLREAVTEIHEFQMDGGKCRVAPVGDAIVMERLQSDAHHSPTWERFYLANEAQAPCRVVEVLRALRVVIEARVRASSVQGA